MITTKNLRLVVIRRDHIEAFQRNKSDLGQLLGVAIPDGWPEFPEALSKLMPLLDPGGESLPASSSPSGWHGYFFIHPGQNVLVGNGGFKGPPDESGTVEIGYEIAVEYRNRGFATEAARGMIEYAFSHEEVQAVSAHTLAVTNASNAVLEKAGMRFNGERADPEEGTVWRWQIRRADYASD